MLGRQMDRDKIEPAAANYKQSLVAVQWALVKALKGMRP
jgi:hypothetical protein